MVSISTEVGTSVLQSFFTVVVAFAILYYVLQSPEDWADRKKKTFLESIYMSVGVYSGIGYTDGAPASARMRAMVMLQAVLAYSKLLVVLF